MDFFLTVTVSNDELLVISKRHGFILFVIRLRFILKVCTSNSAYGSCFCL